MWMPSRGFPGHLHRAEDGAPESRSTVGTVTEIYDYLSSLAGREPPAHRGRPGPPASATMMVDRIWSWRGGPGSRSLPP